MSHRVTVHRCFAAIGVGLTQSQEIFHLNPNSSCSCRYRISYKARDVLLALGEIFVIVNLNVSGQFIPDWRECVVTAIRPRVPRYQGVTVWRILKAYGCGGESGHAAERERIDLYGELARFAGEMAWSEEVRERVRALRDAEKLALNSH